MAAAVATTTAQRAEALEQVLVQGNLKALSPEQRTDYYRRVCDSLGLNPLTKPFEYLELQGKLILYARRDCTEQLRKRDNVSVKITARELVGDVYVVSAQATNGEGRADESIGAVAVLGLKGEALANAMMKAETKAKRRVTLSICGLGMLDEAEVGQGEPPHQQAAPEVRQLPAAAQRPTSAELYRQADAALRQAGEVSCDVLKATWLHVAADKELLTAGHWQALKDLANELKAKCQEKPAVAPASDDEAQERDDYLERVRHCCDRLGVTPDVFALRARAAVGVPATAAAPQVAKLTTAQLAILAGLAEAALDVESGR